MAAIAIRERQPDLAVLVLSQYIEPLYARELLSSGEGSVGHLLKNWVTNVGAFVDAVRQVADGGHRSRSPGDRYDACSV